MSIKSEYQRETRNRNRQQWLDDNGPCVHCGSTERLEVDHVNGDRDPKWVGNGFWTWSKARRAKELSKCQVLCFDCHRRKSGIEKRTAHRKSCKCEECRRVHRDYMRKYRAAKTTTEGKTS